LVIQTVEYVEYAVIIAVVIDNGMALIEWMNDMEDDDSDDR
jgi:hypothetical protein